MRILLLTPYPAYPPHGGGVQRMYHFIRQLSQHHDIWCLSLSPSAEASAAAQPLAQWCHLTLMPAPRRTLTQRAITTLISPLPDMALRAPSATFRTALETMLNTMQFDVVLAESIEMAQYAVHAKRFGAWAALDQWNAEYVLQQRAAQTDAKHPKKWHGALYSWIQWQKLARYEREVCNQLDAVYVVSHEDAASLQKIGITKPLTVIPNGVDTAHFALHAERDHDPECLLFTGTLDFRPNVDAMTWFVHEVLPLIQRERPQAHLQIVGRAPTPAVQALAQQRGVHVVGSVPDVRPYFAQAAVYVLPMRIGGGVRLKLLEALATATPLVSTTMGADGVIGLRDREHCLLADSPSSFAHAVLHLMHERAYAVKLATTGQHLAHHAYDWASIVANLEDSWHQLDATTAKHYNPA